MGADCAVVAARSARAHGVDDRRVISGIVHILRSGARWCDCRLPTEIGDDECEALTVLALTPGRGVAPGRLLVELAVLLQALQNMAVDSRSSSSMVMADVSNFGRMTPRVKTTQ
jgi:hypothetical protein